MVVLQHVDVGSISAVTYLRSPTPPPPAPFAYGRIPKEFLLILFLQDLGSRRYFLFFPFVPFGPSPFFPFWFFSLSFFFLLLICVFWLFSSCFFFFFSRFFIFPFFLPNSLRAFSPFLLFYFSFLV